MPRTSLIVAIVCTSVLLARPLAALQLRQGDLLVTDSANARVLLVDPATGDVKRSPVAGHAGLPVKFPERELAPARSARALVANSPIGGRRPTLALRRRSS